MVKRKKTFWELADEEEELVEKALEESWLEDRHRTNLEHPVGRTGFYRAYRWGFWAAIFWLTAKDKEMRKIKK